VAVAHYLARNRPDIQVRYTTAEQFTAEFVNSLRQDGSAAFKRRYRDLGALLIDDVQFFEAKRQTEEEFFHTFNALYESGSQIVLSSDRPASSLSNLAERLRDRFDWGLAAQLGRPDIATRLTLLRRLGGESANPVPDIAVLNEIAKRTPTNLRQLQGALTKVTAYSSLIGEPPSTAIVRELLPCVSDCAEDGSTPAVTAPREAPPVAIIQDAVCEVTRISRTDMLSTKRTPDVVRARQLAMYLTRELTNLSLKQIAAEFERDHSTIAHGIQSTHSRLEPGNDMHRALERCRDVIGQALD
jgi:chromosomal replication initiator protein